MENIREMIQRHAEINHAGTFMRLGQELKDERQTIIDNLLIMNIIKLDPNYGFSFIGDDTVSNRKIYLEAYENF